MVTKHYRGPDAALRLAREAAAVTALEGRLPVAGLVRRESDRLHFAHVPGTHAKELMSKSGTVRVLASCGRTLKRIHAVDPRGIFDNSPIPPGHTLVHGDYGPNNVLLDAETMEICAVLDWEWSRVGDPVDESPGASGSYGCTTRSSWRRWTDFYGAYGERPSWAVRHKAMVGLCRSLVTFWEQWRPGSEITAHRRSQLATTENWSE
ncbi:phosphotransferase [Streptomyces griseus]|nr:phosphotransferase [Streptomyces griseus]